MQDACRAEGRKISSSVTEATGIAASVEISQKEEASHEESSSQTIGDTGKMRTKPDDASLAVHVAEVEKKAPKAQVKLLSSVV